MDIITEINRLPNYLYAIDIPPYWIILGGEGCKKAEQYDRIEFERLIKKHDNYLKIFNQETMSDEDKKTVALLSKKIRSMCDVRLIQYYTRNQQDEFIKQLPQSEKEKIEKQITLYKQAREFYRDYVNFFTVFLFLYFIFYIIL